MSIEDGICGCGWPLVYIAMLHYCAGSGHHPGTCPVRKVHRWDIADTPIFTKQPDGTSRRLRPQRPRGNTHEAQERLRRIKRHWRIQRINQLLERATAIDNATALALAERTPFGVWTNAQKRRTEEEGQEDSEEARSELPELPENREAAS